MQGGNELNLGKSSVRVTLAGDLPTSAAALGAALRAAPDVTEAQVAKFTIPVQRLRSESSLDLSSNANVSDLDLMVISGFLRVAGSADAVPLHTLKVAPKKVTGKGVVALAAASSLTRLDLSGKMSEGEMQSMGKVLLASNIRSSQLSFKCDAFDVPVAATSLDLSGKGMGAAPATLLAGVLKFSAALTDLKYAPPARLRPQLHVPSLL